jgi:hypothetical protein
VKADGTSLPPRLISDYLERALPGDQRVPRQVRIRQDGQMRLKPGARARTFTATQQYAVERVAFSWDARFRIAPLLAVHVRDAYDDGEGDLAVRLLGRTLQRQHGREVSVGEAMRYLAELPWVPYAMAENAELGWRELDDSRVEVTMPGLEGAGVTLEFDSAGDVVRASSPARPLLDGGTWTPTPWGGEFGDFRTLGPIRMPCRAEVHWQLAGGLFVYWSARVTAAEVLETTFELGT